MNVLDILLAVQQQTQQRAKEVFDSFARIRLDDIRFEFLRSELY